MTLTYIYIYKLIDSHLFGYYQFSRPTSTLLVTFPFTLSPLPLLSVSYEYFTFNKFIRGYFSNVEKSLDTPDNGRSWENFYSIDDGNLGYRPLDTYPNHCKVNCFIVCT